MDVRSDTERTPVFLQRLAIIWGLTLAALFTGLFVYGNSPGPSGPPPEQAPEAISTKVEGQTALSGQQPPWQIVMAVHPQCPCTVASVTELRKILHQHASESASSPVRCQFLYYHPPGEEVTWDQARLHQHLRKVPDSIVRFDENGLLAGQMGMRTSGAVTVFDPEGRTRFHGGITVSRNHEGDNIGSRAVLMLLRGEEPPVHETSVFGCRM
ncbi:RedB [Rhodopirellula sp. JC740]|uniref:RedB n=1 Tax=Rhodopirellula halodulae TaxID=2894198 RepID=A0ABS8NH18_9BACT|nr:MULTISPECIES: RedB [unclassified Rhodopirellula]MCC9642840.1 RedB [Rhodopirellula sp. JC740]MCC9656215.1 RedB [Rhodopirellula sp. JC737]